MWERRMPPLQRVRGKGSLFSNCLAAGVAAAAAALPLAGCLPAEQPGSPAPEAGLKWGLRRRRAGERAAGRGKESAAPGRGCPLSVRPGETQDPVLRATLEGLTRHPACLPKSAPRTWAQPVAPARLPAAPSPRRRPAAGARPRASAGGTRPRCGGSVQLLPAAPEARRAGSSSGCGRAFSLRLCALHLSRVTCRPRHQMSVLR